MLFAYLMRTSGDYYLSGDIMQESFTRYLARYGKREPSAPLLFKIARNALTDHRRKSRRNTQLRDDNELSGENPEHQMIRDRVVDRICEARFDVRPRLGLRFWKPAAAFTCGLAAALFFVFFAQPEPKLVTVPYRFVLYQPDAGQVELAGSFSDWKTLPMEKMGVSGYWEVTVDLYPGEHHYSYILESGRRIPDPAIMTREKDDFGGENSILDIQKRI